MPKPLKGRVSAIRERAVAIIDQLAADRAALGDPPEWSQAEDAAMRAIEQVAIDYENRGFMRGRTARSGTSTIGRYHRKTLTE